MKSMPFSLFAARCLHVAKQPLQYRRDVIRRLFNTRVVTHATLFGVAGVPTLLKDVTPPSQWTQQLVIEAYNHI